jgi:hypothetical protein
MRNRQIQVTVIVKVRPRARPTAIGEPVTNIATGNFRKSTVTVIAI